MPISNYPISKISLKISGTWSQYLQGFIVSSIQTSVDNFFNNFYGILLLEPFLFTPSFQFPFLQCTILLVLQTSSYSRHNNTMSTISVHFGFFGVGGAVWADRHGITFFFKSILDRGTWLLLIIQLKSWQMLVIQAVQGIKIYKPQKSKPAFRQTQFHKVLKLNYIW